MNQDQKCAIKEFFAAVDRLERSGIIRSTRFLGDIGEFLAKEVFQITLTPGLRQPGHDGMIGPDRVQVKFNNSSAGTNIDVGNPDKYDTLIVVVGPKSRLREEDHPKGEFRLYRFPSSAVKRWRSSGGSYYCARERLADCEDRRDLLVASACAP